MSKEVNLESLKVCINNNILNILNTIYPLGKIVGGVFHIGNIQGHPGDSCKIEISGDKVGMWHDFSHETIPSGGDMITLLLCYHDLDKSRSSYLELNSLYGDEEFVTSNSDIVTRNRDVSFTVDNTTRPPPNKPAAVIVEEPKELLSSKTYSYCTADGMLAYKTVRHEYSNGKKDFRVEYVDEQFRVTKQKLFYNSQFIKDYLYIVIVEGEKCADYLNEFFQQEHAESDPYNYMCPPFLAITLSGGCKTPLDKVDFNVLQGKVIMLYPDSDKGGIALMDGIEKELYKNSVSEKIYVLPVAESYGEDCCDVKLHTLHNQIATGLESANTLGTMTIKETLMQSSTSSLSLTSDKLMMPGRVGLVAGPPKIGKSNFILKACMALACGKEFGPFKSASPLKILYIGQELGSAVIWERVSMLLPNFDEKQTEAIHNNMRFLIDHTGMLDEDMISKLQYRAKFRNHVPDIIILDPLSNYFDSECGDENEIKAMKAFLQQRIKTLQNKINPDSFMVIVHHTSKGGAESLPGDNASVRGSSVLTGYMDFNIILSKTKTRLGKVKITLDPRNVSPQTFDADIDGVNYDITSDYGKPRNDAALVEFKYSNKTTNLRRLESFIRSKAFYSGQMYTMSDIMARVTDCTDGLSLPCIKKDSVAYLCFEDTVIGNHHNHDKNIIDPTHVMTYNARGEIICTLDYKNE